MSPVGCHLEMITAGGNGFFIFVVSKWVIRHSFRGQHVHVASAIIASLLILIQMHHFIIMVIMDR